MTTSSRGLGGLKWDSALHGMMGIDSPGDERAREQWPHTTRSFFVRVPPTPLENPELLSLSVPLARAIGLEDVNGLPDGATFDVSRASQMLVEDLGGCRIPDGTTPVAQCYAGHQFGNFAGQLGDGRAISIGAAEARQGESERTLFNICGGRGEGEGSPPCHVELQWKGSGLTPFSRTADGRAVLRSSVREYLCSEAMHALGVPTTRALSLVTSDTRVVRDPLYDGRPVQERACVVVRAAPCFVRFGTFEVFKATDPATGRAGPKHGSDEAGPAGEVLGNLVRSVAAHHFPALDLTAPAGQAPMPELLGAFLEEVAVRTARTVAQWQSVGFCHGVLNTDNLSIVGATIDYGPFGFLDHYNPDHVCNHSDDGGRYTYVRQPEMCRWNVAKLAEALAPVASGDESMLATARDNALAAFDCVLAQETDRLFLEGKLGLIDGVRDGDRELLSSLLGAMADHGADWTVTWRALCGVTAAGAKAAVERIVEACASPADLAKARAPRFSRVRLAMIMRQLEADPALRASADPREIAFIEQQWALSEASVAIASRDPVEMADAARAAFTAWIDRYTARVASIDANSENERDNDNGNGEVNAASRVARQRAHNPRVVLRNWVAQRAIEAVEEGDLAELERILSALRNPFSEPDSACAAADSDLEGPPGDKYAAICVSCSS